MSQTRNPSPLPPAKSSDIWKEAYAIIRHDPDDSTTYSDFREILNAERGRASDARLSSESGRKELVALMDQRRDSIATRKSSTKVQRVLTVMDKLRNVVSLGAASNPFSTVAVAGLFVAFDMWKMYLDASQAMLDIAIDTADIICRSGVESREVDQRDPHEPGELRDLRSRLREGYVQLYRIILLLVMKLVRTLSSKTRMFLAGWSDWPAEHQTLLKMENRVTKSLESISRAKQNMPVEAPNWKFKGRNELHNAARHGQTNEIYRLISSGKCGKDVLNAQTSRGWTALMFAAENGHYAVVEMLLECKGVDVNLTNCFGRTALYLAACKGRAAMVRRLLSTKAAREKVDARDSQGRTAWLMTGKPGYLGCMQALRKAGAELNQTTTKNGHSALHGAIAGNQLEVVQWLLQQGIDTSIKITGGKFRGMTAREQAIAIGNEEIVKVCS